MACSIHEDIIAVVPHLRAFARSLTGDAERADDLVQDTVVRALQAAAQFTPGTNFKAWTFTILRNLHFNELRRKRVTPELRDDADFEGIATPADQEGHVVLAEFRRALLHLAVEQREVLLLIGASGFSYEEAAQICGCPVGTIRSRLFRARERLVQVMGLDKEDAAAEAKPASPPRPGGRSQQETRRSRSPSARSQGKQPLPDRRPEPAPGQRV